MEIRVKKEVFKKLSSRFRVALLVVDDFENKSRLADAKHLLKEMEKLIRLTFQKENVQNHKFIAPWVLARLEFGKSAKHYCTSTEKMINKVLGGRTTAAGNTLDTLLNYISLKHFVPGGGDDLAKLQGDLTFEIASGQERVDFWRKLKRGAFFYQDEKGILGTKFAYWKNRRTKLSKNSTSALIHLESLPPMTEKKFKEIVQETESLIKAFCRGNVKVFILTKRTAQAMI